MSDAVAPTVELPSGKGRGDENFPVGSLLIRRALRPHIHAFYAFARHADDIADHPTLTRAEKLRRLDIMAGVVDGSFDNGAPAARRLRQSLAACRLPPVHALDLITAFKQDAIKARYRSWDELLTYCRFSAMPVGRQVLDFHGYDPGQDRTGWAASDALCAVLQILNHMQDCAKDLMQIDRCYLPADWLAAAGSGIDDLYRDRTTPALRTVFDQLLDACDRLLVEARALPRLTRDRRLRAETAAIVILAERLAARLRVGDPLAFRVALSKGDFVAALVRGLSAAIDPGAARPGATLRA